MYELRGTAKPTPAELRRGMLRILPLYAVALALLPVLWFRHWLDGHDSWIPQRSQRRH